MTYLRFVEAPSPGRVTRIWEVHSRGGSWLGRVSWYAQWRRYTYSPAWPQHLDAACMRELADFCERETEGRKEERGGR